MKKKKRNIIFGLCIAFASFLSFAYVNISYQHTANQQMITIEESEKSEMDEEIFFRDGDTKILIVALDIISSMIARKA